MEKSRGGREGRIFRGGLKMTDYLNEENALAKTEIERRITQRLADEIAKKVKALERETTEDEYDETGNLRRRTITKETIEF